MNRNETILKISEILNQIIQEKGYEQRDIHEETKLLGGDIPIDSLDLATIVVELQRFTRKDPFRDGFVNFRTVGELANLYST